MADAESVRALLEPPLAAEGLEVVDIQVGPGLLRVLVDLPEGGIDLDQVTAATRQVNALLDNDDPLPGRYTLEVSSPGIERPLRTPDHFRRHVGEIVAIKTTPSTEGERRFQGLLTDADDEGVTVSDRRLSYAEIERARTVFVWDAQPKQAKPPKPPKQKKAER